MNMVLYRRQSRHCFTGIYAEMCCGKLTITRHELDDDDDIDEAESFTYFNEWHTAKLMKALEVETPHELLVALKKRFRREHWDTGLDRRIREFCDGQGIKYRTSVYY